MEATLSRSWRGRLGAWVESSRIQRFLIALIVVNAVILGMETSPSLMARWGELLVALDRIILAVFVVEIAIRLVAHGPRFFRDPWSVFDFAVVAIALVPASGPFAVLRALRVLRVLRLLTMVPSMRRVVAGLLSAIPGLGSVFAILMLIFYVASVIATQLFAEKFPDWFGSIGASAYTLFQIMTLESWSMGIARPVMEAFPYAWIFFVLFILIATFTMLESLHRGDRDCDPRRAARGNPAPRRRGSDARRRRHGDSAAGNRRAARRAGRAEDDAVPTGRLTRVESRRLAWRGERCQ